MHDMSWVDDMETVISFKVKSIDNGFLLQTKFSEWDLHEEHVVMMDNKFLFCNDYEEVGDVIAAELEELNQKIRDADAATFSKLVASE